MGAYINQQGKKYLLHKNAIFHHFWARNGHFQARNGHFQDKKSINQLVLEQFYRISALQITGCSGVLGLLYGLWCIFCRKNSYFIYSYANKDNGMIRCEKNNNFKIGDFVSASFTLTDT